MMVAAFVVLGILVALFVWSVVSDRMRRRFALRRSLATELFRISLPRALRREDQPQDIQRERTEIGVMEQLYVAFSRLAEKGMASRSIGRPHVTFELAVPTVGEDITFYAAAPARFADDMEKAIHGIYGNAQIERIRDYNIFHPYGVAAGAVVKLSRHYTLPIRTYQQLEVDPLATLTTVLSKLAAE